MIGKECWCYHQSGYGNEVCGYPSNYDGRYYSLARDSSHSYTEIIEGLGKTVHPYHCDECDCATNQCTSNGCYGTSLSCYSDQWRWARGHAGIVRCVNMED